MSVGMLVLVFAGMSVAAVAVAVVGPAVQPAVEKVGGEVPRQHPENHRGQGAALRGVGKQIEAHHAEHDAGGEPQQQADGAVRRGVDHRRQGSAQGQGPHAGDGCGEEKFQVDVHAKTPI